MTERDETYARIAEMMIEQKAQYNRDSAFLVPVAVRDTGRAVERLRDLYRFGSIRTAIVIPDAHLCPVCGRRDDRDFTPRDYNICGCCGVEFGYDDDSLTNAQLRQEWLSRGGPWFDDGDPPPPEWDAHDQLRRAGIGGVD